MLDLHKAIEMFSGLAGELFNNLGYLKPSYFICHQGEWQYLPEPSNHPKELVMMAMRKLLRSSGAEAYVFMDEAWIVESKNQEALPLDIAPSEHPDRREVVVITAEDETGQLIARRNILRPDNGKPSLAPLEIYGEVTLKGRMTNLMSRREGGGTVH
jgi:hypothetical protein